MRLCGGGARRRHRGARSIVRAVVAAARSPRRDARDTPAAIGRFAAEDRTKLVRDRATPDDTAYMRIEPFRPQHIADASNRAGDGQRDASRQQNAVQISEHIQSGQIYHG